MYSQSFYGRSISSNWWNLKFMAFFSLHFHCILICFCSCSVFITCNLTELQLLFSQNDALHSRKSEAGVITYPVSFASPSHLDLSPCCNKKNKNWEDDLSQMYWPIKIYLFIHYLFFFFFSLPPVTISWIYPPFKVGIYDI